MVHTFLVSSHLPCVEVLVLPPEASLASAPLQGVAVEPLARAVLPLEPRRSCCADRPGFWFSGGQCEPWPCLECSSTDITMTKSLTCFRLLLKITFSLKLHWPLYFKWHPTPSDIPNLILIFPIAFISLKHTLVIYLFIISITRFPSPQAIWLLREGK